MIRPLLLDDRFLEDVEAARRQPESLHLWWLGQSGFLVQWQGKHLILDPYLSDSLTRKYAGTDKPHVRMTERVIAPERLDFVDVVTSSHNHTDHLDAETLVPLFCANPSLRLVAPSANLDFVLQRLGIEHDRVISMDEGESVEVAGFRFQAVPAAHESVERDEQGRCRYLGYVVQAGPRTIYHSGDTVLYEGMADLLWRWQIDVALLPINGTRPERRVAGNLDGPQAARLAHDIGAGVVIPCHYEMFEFNTASPEEFLAEAARLGQPTVVLRAGERWSARPEPQFRMGGRSSR